MAGFKKSFDVESLRIGVVGAGSWGTALSNLLALKGYKVDLWVFEQEVIEQIRSHPTLPDRLPSPSDHR